MISLLPIRLIALLVSRRRSLDSIYPLARDIERIKDESKWQYKFTLLFKNLLKKNLLKERVTRILKLQENPT